MGLVRVRQAAAFLEHAPATLYSKRWRQRVGLQAVRIGRSLRFNEEDLQRIIRQNREALPVGKK